MERFQNAVDLVKNGQYQKATDEFIWLWNHMLDADKCSQGVRGSYLIDWMKRLMELHEDARVQFTALRDKLTPYFEPGSRNYRPIMDWFILSNSLLEDHAAVGSWIDDLLASDSQPLELQIMRVSISNWLYDHERWADAGRISEPGGVVIARARLRIEEEKHNDRYDEKTMQSLAEMRRRELVRAHVSYLAANRDAEAWETAGLLLEHFDKKQTSVAIQEAAKIAGVESAKHKHLIREFS